ncbi:hypothetical protein [Demequina soli]|nr:hypothetical protein [Demequina soli]
MIGRRGVLGALLIGSAASVAAAPAPAPGLVADGADDTDEIDGGRP